MRNIKVIEVDVHFFPTFVCEDVILNAAHDVQNPFDHLRKGISKFPSTDSVRVESPSVNSLDPCRNAAEAYNLDSVG